MLTFMLKHFKNDAGGSRPPAYLVTSEMIRPRLSLGDVIDRNVVALRL
jgi:hypothetical protein